MCKVSCRSPGTYTKGQEGVESGSTVGVHTICTQLRHWSEGRPATFVPDVQGNLSRDKSGAVRKDTTGTHRPEGTAQLRGGGCTDRGQH